MLNVGLTGGIAGGKSTVARILAEKGALLIDFDELAHDVQRPDGPVWHQIVRRFGPEVIGADGRIDRRTLGAIVFADPRKRELLNRLVHPAVLDLWRARIDEIRTSQPEAIVLSDVPLLFEAGLKGLFDLVLVVYLPPEEQICRLMRRDGFSRREAERRLAAQMPIGEKIAGADIVLDNEGSEEDTRRKLDDVWEELKKRERLLRDRDL